MSVLTKDDLAEITGKTKAAWQARELEHLGIPYRRRSNGSLLVFWEDVRGTKGEQPRRPQLRLS